MSNIRMTRVEIPETTWRQFRMAAIKMDTTTPALLGAVVESYLARRRRAAEDRVEK
jgi:hypothetical protein